MGVGGVCDVTPQIAVVSPLDERQRKRAKIAEFAEDDNADIAYWNVRLVHVSGIVAVLAVAFTAAAICRAVAFVPQQELIRNWNRMKYGGIDVPCPLNETVGSLPPEDGGLPSILRMFQLSVPGNVMFRVATVVPIAVRFFHALTYRSLFHSYGSKNRSWLFRAAAELCPIFSAIELSACALFSIVTVRLDFNWLHDIAMLAFIIAGGLYQLVLTALSFTHINLRHSINALDEASLAVKLLCTAVFAFVAPQFIGNYREYIYPPSLFSPCHGIVPRFYALVEYVMFAVYGIFHLTALVDLRHIRFICYPRTASGECEPLDPENFKKGGKFEHCRSHELAARRRQQMDKQGE